MQVRPEKVHFLRNTLTAWRRLLLQGYKSKTQLRGIELRSGTRIMIMLYVFTPGQGSRTILERRVGSVLFDNRCRCSCGFEGDGLRQRREEVTTLEGLGEVVVHPRRETSFFVAWRVSSCALHEGLTDHGVSSECDDGCSDDGLGELKFANQACGLHAAHDRH